MKEWVCAGTQLISITDDSLSQPSSNGDGIISVYEYLLQRSDVTADGTTTRNSLSPFDRLGGSSGDNCCIHLVVTDGSHTFHERLVPRDIKHITSENDQDALDQMTFILLHNDKNENTKFLIAYERAARSIRISIRKTINNLVRPVWEGQMDDIRHTAYGNLPPFVRSAFRSQSSPCQRLSSSPSSSSTPSSSGLAFSRMLGETVAKLQKEVASLKKDNQQLQKNSMQWKSTSDKLINQWQTEKSELTANFLTLFNQHKARHIETFKELEQLKKKHYHESAESNINGNSHLQNREAVVDHEDEHDYVTYDDSLVARLASGPSKKKMRVNDDRKPIHKNQPSLSKKSFPDDVQSSQCSTGFLNPHTGALEISNYKEMFSSDEEEAAV